MVNVSSDAGSFAMVGGGCSYAYPASKAALNMMTRCMSGDLKTAGVIVAAVHPGFVRTDMGGPGAHMAPEENGPLAGKGDRRAFNERKRRLLQLGRARDCVVRALRAGAAAWQRSPQPRAA